MKSTVRRGIDDIAVTQGNVYPVSTTPTEDLTSRQGTKVGVRQGVDGGTGDEGNVVRQGTDVVTGLYRGVNQTRLNGSDELMSGKAVVNVIGSQNNGTRLSVNRLYWCLSRGNIV